MDSAEPYTTSVEYWDRKADTWHDEIQNTLMDETNSAMRNALDEFVTGADLAVDVGCGVGNYLRALACRAHTVIGVDISPRCIEHAQTMCRKYGLRNCQLFVVDLGSPDGNECKSLGITSAAVVLCVNALISPDPCTRNEMLRKASQTLREPSAASNGSGGTLLLVYLPLSLRNWTGS